MRVTECYSFLYMVVSFVEIVARERERERERERGRERERDVQSVTLAMNDRLEDHLKTDVNEVTISLKKSYF